MFTFIHAVFAGVLPEISKEAVFSNVSHFGKALLEDDIGYVLKTHCSFQLTVNLYNNFVTAWL